MELEALALIGDGGWLDTPADERSTAVVAVPDQPGVGQHAVEGHGEPPEAALARDCVQAIAADEHDDEADELLQIIAMAEPSQRKYKQRSWELMAAARAKKKAKKDLQTIARQEETIAAHQKEARELAAVVPVVARRLGLKATRHQCDNMRATLCVRLAFMPVIRGNHAARASQSKACTIVAAVFKEECAKSAEAMLYTRHHRAATMRSDEENQLADLSQFQVAALAWEWDETSQRLQPLRSAALRGERKALHSVAVQVMVQRGEVNTFEWGGDAAECRVNSQPFLVKGLQLPSTAADFLLEAMLKSMPVDPSDTSRLTEMAAQHDLTLLLYCCDRASSNLSCLRWYFEQIAQSADKTVLTFAELCASHGVSLSKARATAGKDLVRTAASFTCLTKNWRFMDTMRNSIIALVGEHLQVKRERRPQADKDATARVVKVLFGDMHDAISTKRHARGSKNKSRLQNDLDEICRVFSMAPGCDMTQMCHYCWVEPGSAEFEAGASEGSACCKDRQEAVEKTAVAFLNVIIHSSWPSGGASRWTYTVATLRRLCLGFCCNRLLPECLRDVQIHWNCADSLEQTLLRMVAADEKDFHSRSRLRLLRVVRGLCQADSGWKAAILLISLAIADKVLFAILGNGEGRDRATLYDLISVGGSLLAKANQELLELLETWQPGSEAWELFEVMDGAFGDEATRRWARWQLLQLSCGFTDTFELRYSRPPFNLMCLNDPEATLEEKASAYQTAVDMHPHCRPLILERLLSLFPDFHSMCGRGARTLHALNQSATISVDFSERTHAQMRQDMKSSVRSKSASLSASRVYCQQVRAEFVRKGWSDFANDPMGKTPASHPSGSHIGCKGRAGAAKAKSSIRKVLNPYLLFLNFSMSSFKKTFAINRNMTSAEQSTVRAQAREAWGNMSEPQRQQWTLMYKARRLQKEMQQHEQSIVLAPAGERKPTVPLWLLQDSGGDQPLPLKALCAGYSNFGAAEAERMFDDPEVKVLGPVPPRASTLAPREDNRDLVFGCCHSRKNICRFTLSDQVHKDMHTVLALLSAWVHHIGEAAKHATSLLWLRGTSVLDDASHIDSIVLLCDSFQSPKMQYLARCSIGDSPDLQFLLPDFPFLARIATRASRLSPRFKQLCIMTSDEVAHELAGVGGQWTARPLRYDMEGEGSLLEMRILGAEAPVELGRHRPPPRVVRRARIEEEVFLGDPLEAPADRPNFASDVAAPAGGVSADGESALELLLAGCEDDDIAADVLRCDAGVAEEVSWGGDGSVDAGAYTDDPDIFGDDAFAERPTEAAPELGEEAAIAAASGGAGAGGATAGEGGEVWTRAVVSPTGYISVEMPPWNRCPTIGRITSWPSTEAPERRSVSVRCYMHTTCCSPAKRRWAVSDEHLLRWLLSMEPTDGTAAAKKAGAAVHKAQWAAIFSNGGAPSAGASGAASSSGSGRP